MKALNRSNIIKFIIISIMAVVFVCVATSCESPSARRARTASYPKIHDTVAVAPIEHMPLWKCTMVWSDSVTVETYTYAKDRYDADRTLTRDLDDQSYVSYKLDTVAVMPAVKE